MATNANRYTLTGRWLRFPLSVLSQTALANLLNDLQSAIKAVMGTDGASAPTETVTSGALNPAIALTRLSVTGTQAYTLAAGTYIGQVKQIRCVVAASVPSGVVTIATLLDGSAHTLTFTALQQSAELVWDGTNWNLASLQGATLA